MIIYNDKDSNKNITIFTTQSPTKSRVLSNKNSNLPKKRLTQSNINFLKSINLQLKI